LKTTLSARQFVVRMRMKIAVGGFRNDVAERRPARRAEADAPEDGAARRYTPASLRRAISRACDAAGVPRWTRYRLRHSAATRVRKEYGIEAAQVVLGHATANITQAYAERNQALAVKVMQEMREKRHYGKSYSRRYTRRYSRQPSAPGFNVGARDGNTDVAGPPWRGVILDRYAELLDVTRPKGAVGVE
jgi:hypothetical protein